MRRLLLLAALTVPAAAQWTIQTPATTADLRGIDNVGKGIAWASGTDGTVLRTEDNGYLWQRCTTPPGAEHLDFRGIQAFDANTAIVMSSGKGDLSRLYKTTDGCQTWKQILKNYDKDGFWDAISFPTPQFGLLLGDPVDHKFFLFETKNSGRSWTQRKNRGLRADSKTQGAFAASNSSLSKLPHTLLFATGGASGAFIYRLTGSTVCLDNCDEDKDKLEVNDTWDKTPIPIGKRTAASGIFAIAMRSSFNDDHGLWGAVAVGGDYTKPDDPSDTAAYTIDGGDNWTAAATPPHGYRSAVAYDAPTKSWITVGPNGTDISTDDGRNWHPLKPSAADTPDADRNWNALSLPFAVGPHGRIGLLNPTALKPPTNP